MICGTTSFWMGTSQKVESDIFGRKRGVPSKRKCIHRFPKRWCFEWCTNPHRRPILFWKRFIYQAPLFKARVGQWNHHPKYMEQFFKVFVKSLMYHPLPPEHISFQCTKPFWAKIQQIQQKLWTVQAVVGLAVGSFADRAIANGVPVGRLRKILQTVGGNTTKMGHPGGSRGEVISFLFFGSWGEGWKKND